MKKVLVKYFPHGLSYTLSQTWLRTKLPVLASDIGFSHQKRPRAGSSKFLSQFGSLFLYRVYVMARSKSKYCPVNVVDKVFFFAGYLIDTVCT